MIHDDKDAVDCDGSMIGGLAAVLNIRSADEGEGGLVHEDILLESGLERRVLSAEVEEAGGALKDSVLFWGAS